MFFLMRHAEASWAANSDLERELTDAGKQALFRLITDNLKSLQGIQKIVSSPYLRTRQTAKLVADAVGVQTIEFEKRLRPEISVNEALAGIEKHWSDNLLVVTHQPLIGNLISYIEHGNYVFIEPVTPGSIYGFSMEWPGPSSALRESVFSV